MIRKREDYYNLMCPFTKNECYVDKCVLWEKQGFVDADNCPYNGEGKRYPAGYCALTAAIMKIFPIRHKPTGGAS